MKSEELKSTKTPLKEKYREMPQIETSYQTKLTL